MTRDFRKLIEDRWSLGKFVCVGLDSEFGKIPVSALVGRSDDTNDTLASIFKFNTDIVNATHDQVCAFKPNLAFYIAQGPAGIAALRSIIEFSHRVAPGVPVLLDAKVADIGNTNNGYVEFAFGYLRVDAITVHPYLGSEALEPFLAQKEKGIFVLCRTSNSGAGELQNLPVVTVVSQTTGRKYTSKFYTRIATRVAEAWNKYGNCGLVVGATAPEDELAKVRSIVGDMPILIPGIGAQGGDLEKSIKCGQDSRGRGMIINSSRGIIFASSGPDYAEAARREVMKLHEAINACR